MASAELIIKLNDLVRVAAKVSRSRLTLDQWGVRQRIAMIQNLVSVITLKKATH